MRKPALYFYLFKKNFKGSKKYLDFSEPLKYNKYIRR